MLNQVLYLAIFTTTKHKLLLENRKATYEHKRQWKKQILVSVVDRLIC